MNIKKYVDESGLTHLWTRIEENYPTNEDLTNVINAIDEEKADKVDLFSGSWDDLTDKPFDSVENWSLISDNFTSSNRTLIVLSDYNDLSKGFTQLGTYRFTINDTDVYLYEKTSNTGQFLIGDSSMQNLPFFITKVALTGNLDSYFQLTGPGTAGMTTCKAEYYTNVINYLDDKYLSNKIARTKALVGLKTSQGGEVFNEYANNYAGSYAHAEGYLSTAAGPHSHSEGRSCQAYGDSSHAEGFSTHTHADFCHAEGKGTEAHSDCQHVQGKYNIEDSLNKYAHIVGNGDDDINPSNAHTLDWEGNAWFAGDVYVGSTEGSNKDEGSQKLATEGYVNSSIDNALAEVSSDTIVEQNKNRDIKFWVGTEAELDLIETRDENCLYFTTDSEEEENVSAAARCTTVTLNANNWTLNENNIYVQEVQASGVLADANAQLITISPYGNDLENHLLVAEVFCIEQKENALVFRAINEIPEGNVQLLIVLEDINQI